MQLARSIVEVILHWTTQQQRLDRAANHDDLTQLPNRKPFFRALEHGSHGAILYCDLDDFKPVNDHYGHAAGDEVLRQVAQRLRSCVRESDVVARIGGDEFAVLCPHSTAEEAQGLAARIHAAFDAPFLITDGQVQIGISIGVSHTPDRLNEAIVADADRRLRDVKAQRRATRRPFESGTHSRDTISDSSAAH
jgi:diguanylate cyclase (GGDEF)-like protein